LDDVELSQRLSDAATERALTKFTWRAAQKKLVKVYDRLLA
jgi:glycosyltransferase involved in cell wall biosynthesis